MYVETVFVKEEWDVEKRLNELGLDKRRLLTVRNIAVDAARTHATNFHASNGSGTMSYQNGVWALRDQFVDDIWEVSRPNGVETISNERLRVRIGFCNVDKCCVDSHGPKPRSDKKSGSEKVANLMLFEHLPQFAPAQAPSNRWALYYLMVDTNGACELTRPVISDSTFNNWLERIYLSDGTDLEADKADFGSGDETDVFEPRVTRKV